MSYSDYERARKAKLGWWEWLTKRRLSDRWGRKTTHRFEWGEVTFGCWGLSLTIDNFSDDDGGRWSLHVRPIYGAIHIYLPILGRREPKSDSMMDSWGFIWWWDADDTSSIHWRWGERYHITHLPWHPTWVRTSTLLKDGTWDHERRGQRKPPGLGDRRMDDWSARRAYLAEHRWEETYPYTYVLKSGEVQKRTATVSVKEREWRWRWFTWLPITIAKRGLWLVYPQSVERNGRQTGRWYNPARHDPPRKPLLGDVQRTIDVEFDDEVGERSGSWKGGTMGCGYEMRASETPWETLRRMERERKF